MGEEPDWYPVLRAAKYLGVPPWDLAERPIWWTEIALAAQSAEAAARNQKAKKANANGSRT
jgi:hypothetical protein